MRRRPRIRRRAPSRIQIEFEAATFYCRKKPRIIACGRNKRLRITDGFCYPMKEVVVEDREVRRPFKVSKVLVCAREIEAVKRKIRGSARHHKFLVSAKDGHLVAA